jgi:L-methionine (R)-S-oxide reductase
MHNADNVVFKMRDPLDDIEFNGSLDELSELSSMVAEALNARQCAITMLSEQQVAEIGLLPGSKFGDVRDPRSGMTSPDGHGRPHSHSVSISGADIRSAATRTEMGSDSHPRDKMFSVIVLQGKAVGVVHAYEPQQSASFSADDLKLLEILTLLITKAIQAIQLQRILESRFTQMALTRSSEKTIGEIVAGSAQNPNQIARMLAKSFYREMANAGFNFNQIIHAASEIISELSNNVRKHHDGHRRPVAGDDGPGDSGNNVSIDLARLSDSRQGS